MSLDSAIIEDIQEFCRNTLGGADTDLPPGFYRWKSGPSIRKARVGEAMPSAVKTDGLDSVTVTERVIQRSDMAVEGADPGNSVWLEWVDKADSRTNAAARLCIIQAEGKPLTRSGRPRSVEQGAAWLAFKTNEFLVNQVDASHEAIYTMLGTLTDEIKENAELRAKLAYEESGATAAAIEAISPHLGSLMDLGKKWVAVERLKATGGKKKPKELIANDAPAEERADFYLKRLKTEVNGLMGAYKDLTEDPPQEHIDYLMSLYEVLHMIKLRYEAQQATDPEANTPDSSQEAPGTESPPEPGEA